MATTNPVTGTEKSFSYSAILLSTTDIKGNVTYANPDFCDIAGFQLSELTGKPHNIVRHPDMPEAAFADLWGTIATTGIAHGQESTQLNHRRLNINIKPIGF
jgi:PAS domain S-box-containing protein